MTLKPCRFCNSRQIMVEIGQRSFRVFCRNCAAAVVSRQSVAAAKSTWNCKPSPRPSEKEDSR